jgi:hypothetical protein
MMDTLLRKVTQALNNLRQADYDVLAKTRHQW